MNPLNPYRWQKKAPRALHAIVPHHRSHLNRIFKMLSIAFLWLTCQFANNAAAETSDVDYSVPPPIEIPTAPIEIKEPQGVLSLSEALSLALLHNPELASFAWEVQGERSPNATGWIVA